MSFLAHRTARFCLPGSVLGSCLGFRVRRLRSGYDYLGKTNSVINLHLLYPLAQCTASPACTGHLIRCEGRTQEHLQLLAKEMTYGRDEKTIISPENLYMYGTFVPVIVSRAQMLSSVSAFLLVIADAILVLSTGYVTENVLDDSKVRTKTLRAAPHPCGRR